jgi:hypothetical protein
VCAPTRRPVMSMPLLVAVLLVISAAMFGLGVAAEHGNDADNHAPSSAEPAPSGHTETGPEGSESTRAGEQPGQNANHAEAPAPERVLGVPAESPQR